MLPQVHHPVVRRNLIALFIGSGVLFGANITIGILNVFMDEISRAQILAHFHAGAIGWVTLTVLGTAIWFYLAGRNLGKSHAIITGIISGVGLLAVLGYIFAFALAFGETGDYMMLLPAFGIPTALVIWTTLIYVATQVKKQDVLTTPHVLLLCALIVISLGAAMGVVLGMSHATDFDPYPDGDAVDALGSHAGPMDMYLALAFAAIIEASMMGRHAPRRSWAGITQGTLGVVSAFAVSVSLFLGIQALAPVSLLLFVAAFGFHFVRIGWRTLKVNPVNGKDGATLFFSGLFFPAYVFLFVFLVFVYFIPGEVVPHALYVAFQHITFVGLGTTLMLTIQSSFAPHPRTDRAINISVWLIVAGLFAFIAGEFAEEMKHGALLMAAGVLMGVLTVWIRLLHAPAPEPNMAWGLPMAAEVTDDEA